MRFRIQDFFFSGSGVVDEKWKIHNNTMANGNLVMMGGGGANLSCDLDSFVFPAITFFCYLG
jgi:hypothetical protein